MKRFLTATASAALLGLGVLFLTADSATAYIVCNDEGDCWHSHYRYRHPVVHFIYHDDDWYFHHDWDHDRDHRWREYHDEHGYWRNGVWIRF